MDKGGIRGHHACMTLQMPAQPSATPRLLRLDEAAQTLAVSRRYLNELLTRGRLRAVRIDPMSPKTARIRSDDLDRFMNGLPSHAVGAA